MENFQKQKFEGDLGLSTTALFFAQRYGDIHLTIEEAAPHLHLTPATIRNQIWAGEVEVHFFKLGGKWVVHVSDLAEFVEKARNGHSKLPHSEKRRRGAPRKAERVARAEA